MPTIIVTILAQTRTEILISNIRMRRPLQPLQKVVACPDIPEAPVSPCNVHDYHQWWDTGTMSLTVISFGTPGIQKASESGNATDPRSDAQDVPMDEDTQDSALDKEGDATMAKQQLNQKMN